MVNKVLVDTGCFKLDNWIKTYKAAVGREFEKIKRRDEFRISGKNCKTIMFKLIPVKIGNHQEDTEVGVIDVEFPLSLSIFKLKDRGGTIDFEENVLHLKFTNEDVKLERRDSFWSPSGKFNEKHQE